MSKKIGSVEDFYEWVKSRDPEETYLYTDIKDCAIARYCRDRGVEYRYTVVVRGPVGSPPTPVGTYSALEKLAKGPRTFGELRQKIEWIG